MNAEPENTPVEESEVTPEPQVEPEKPQGPAATGPSQEEIDRMAAERLRAALPPGLRAVVDQDPSKMDEILRWGAEKVEEELSQGAKKKAPAPKEPESDFLDQAYDYMKAEAMKDQERGLDEEEIRRRHWRRDMELRTALSERKAQEVIARERNKAMQMQQFFAQNPDYASPLVANEVVRRVEAGEPIARIQAEMQPLIDQQKAYYGIPAGQPGPGPRPVPAQQRRPQAAPSNPWENYTEPTGSVPEEEEDFLKKTEEDIKNLIKKAKTPDEIFDNKIWEKGLKLVKLDLKDK